MTEIIKELNLTSTNGKPGKLGYRIEYVCFFFVFFIKSDKQPSCLFNAPACEHLHVNSAHPVFNIDEISEIQVVNILLKNSNAKDDNGLAANFLKLNMESLVCPVMHLINLSIKHSVVPSPWKVSIVNPVFKYGSSQTLTIID